MPGRRLADVDKLGREIMLDALAAFPVPVKVRDRQPAGYVLEYPTVIGYRIPGGGAVDPQFLDRALYQVDVYDDDEDRAREIAEWCRTALAEAAEFGTPFSNGSISSYSEQAGPAVLDTAGQPAGETFVPATYQLYVCP